MKKTSLLTPSLLLFLALILAACGGSEQPVQVPTAVPDSTSARLTEDFSDALPASAQLIIGSMQLDETDNAITEAQAAELLPLWQAYQALSNSDTTAQAELSALVNQIQDSMDPAQIEAIAAMQLTAEAAQAMIQEQGFAAFGRGQNAGGEAGQEGGFRPGGGGLPGGGRPGGGPGGLGGGQLDPEARATAIAERFGDGDSPTAFLETAMLNGLIRNLQIKTGEIAESALPARSPGGNRFLDLISEASGVSTATLQAALESGQSFAEAIAANDGDLAAAEAALREQFSGFELDAEALEQRVEQILNGVAVGQ